MPKQPTKTKRDRLTMRIPTDLLDWVRDFSKEKRKTVTQVVVDHFVELKEKENAKAARISG
jgi:glutamine synthetase